MSHIFHSGLLVLLSAVAVAGCGGSTKPTAQAPGDDPTRPAAAMTLEDARGQVAAFADSIGSSLEPSAPAPISIADAVDIFKKDDVVRFDQAISYLSGIQGLESLALRAALDAYRAGMLLGLADFFNASAVKLSAEAAQLESKAAGGSPLSVDEENRRRRFSDEAATKRRLSDALRVIAGDRLSVAETLATDLMTQFPDKPAGYQSMARVHQLRGEWRLFDENIKEAERLLGDAPGFSVQYQRVFEAWKRNASPDDARVKLEALRDSLPDYVRIQASLVFLQPDISARYAELQKLKAMNPGHLLVLLAGPSIQKEYETASAIRDALAPAGTSAASDGDGAAESGAGEGTADASATDTTQQ